MGIIKDLSKISINQLDKKLENISKRYARFITQSIKNKKTPTFHNLISKWDEFEMEYRYIYYLMFLYRVVDCFPKYEKNLLKANKNQDKLETMIYTNKVLYNKLLYIKNNEQLTKEELMVLDTVLKSFIDSGILLLEGIQRKLVKVNRYITHHESTIEHNIIKHNEKIKLHIKDEKIVKDMPEKWKEESKKMAKGKGYIVNHHNESIFYKKMKDRKIKHKYVMMQSKLALTKPYDNSIHVLNLIKLYNYKASLLGHESFQTFKVKDFAYDIKKAKKDIELVLKNTHIKAKKEKYKLLEMAKKHDIHELRPFDLDYIIDKQKKEDSFEIEDYLNVNNIFNGMNLLLKKLFDAKIKKTKIKSIYEGIQVWNVYVKNKYIGQIHFDLWKRDGKMDGALMYVIKSPSEKSEEGQVLIQTSIDKNKIRLYDYSALFHELGHAMHCLLSETKYSMVAGTDISYDLIETPSTVFETLALNKKFMESWMIHNKTKMPLVLKKNFIDNKLTKTIDLRQYLITSLIDIEVYQKSTKRFGKSTIVDIENKYYKKYGNFYKKHKDPLTMSLNHVVGGGYESTFYVYFLSEVISHILASKFNINGTNWRKEGLRLKNALYSKGSSIDNLSLLNSLVGSKMNLKPYLREKLR